VYERLKSHVRSKNISRNGNRRRNFMIVDFGEDALRTKEILQQIAAIEGRTLSSYVREVLRRHVSNLRKSG
jgi:hypothetical protein